MFRRFGTSPAAHWASWKDCLPTLQKRHPGVARMIITRLSDLHVSGVNVSRERLLDVSYNVPSWEHIADGLRPGVPAEDPEPGVPLHGWQFHAAQAIRGGSRARSATPWVAVPRSSGYGRLFLSARSGPTAHRHAAGDGEVPVRTTRWCSFHLSPHIAVDSLRRSGFPVVASPPLAPSPIVRLCLPVWPSTRRPWPPPVSVCDVGSFGSERLCT